MKLEELGFSSRLNWDRETFPEGSETGRVISEHKERYVVKTATGEFDAEITGNLRYTAQSREDFPAVGDWVVLTIHDTGFAIIHSILPRLTVIKRKAAGHSWGEQVIAANIDCAFLVQAVDRDFNINRLERYLAICYSAKVKPVIVLTKTDLADEKKLSEINNSLKERLEDITVIAISNETKNGYDTLLNLIEAGKTYCMLGSSGVGKSTLLNNLSGKKLMKTGAVSQSSNKGKHITSHRELIILDNGGILIDNPGMREVGIADTGSGVESAFSLITQLSQKCKFKDCTHTSEVDCAVLDALENNELDYKSYENYRKMEREKAHFESTVSEQRKKEKRFGKIVKDYYKKDIKNKIRGK